jgi:hypothetical protein
MTGNLLAREENDMTSRIDLQVSIQKEAYRFYSPDLLAQMQDLLSILANLDCALDSALKTAKNCPRSEPAKLALIKELQQRHYEQSAPLVIELAVLEKKIAQDLRL